MKDISRNKNTRTFVRFKKRKSIKEKIKKTAKDITTQITCLLKKSPVTSSGAKDFIVTNPAATIGKMKQTSSQSILLSAFSAIPFFPTAV